MMEPQLTLNQEFFDEYFEEIFATVPQPELAKDILAAMVCSAEPVGQQLLLNKISSVGLQELIQVGLLRQQERSIRFAYPEMRRVVTDWVKDRVSLPLIHKKIAEAWMELVERWGLAFGSSDWSSLVIGRRTFQSPSISFTGDSRCTECLVT